MMCHHKFADRRKELDAALRANTGFMLSSLYGIVLNIPLFNLPGAYVLSQDALKQCVGRSLDLPPLFAALDRTVSYFSDFIRSAVPGTFIAILDGGESAAAEDHVVVILPLDGFCPVQHKTPPCSISN